MHGLDACRDRRGARLSLLLVAWAVCASLAVRAEPVRADASGEAARVGEVAPDAAELIASMSEAMRALSYEGTLVQLSGGNMTSMHVLHSSDERGELERLVSLDGEAREVTLNHAVVTCIWPATGAVHVTRSRPRDALPDIDPSLASNERYALRLGATDRVAGLAVRIVDIEPRDGLRYGYRFWIDIDTRMLLRSMLIDERKRSIEQVMFTHIDYPDSIDPARFEVVVPHGGRTLVAIDPDVAGGAVPARAGGGAASGEVPDHVAFEGLPAGYDEVSESWSAMPIDEGPVSHVMVSDGVASVSVYVEHVARAAQDRSAEGLSSMGGMSAWGRSLEDGFVTVVGEVPARTVQLIAAAVRLR